MKQELNKLLRFAGQLSDNRSMPYGYCGLDISRRATLAVALVWVISPWAVQAQVVPIPEITDAFIESRTIDTGKPVGQIDGAHGVTSTGAATYTIPLSIPPGTNGMAPTLALTYNSFAGDGLLGVGWGLSGLSSITRIGADMYHDGTTTPVKFSNADYFALDGQRLVNTYGSYHASNTVYDSENAQFAFITREGSYGSGPAGFKAIFKNGMTHWYGFVDSGSNSALALRSSGGEVLAWLLSKTEDPFGNIVRYVYSNNDLTEAKRITSIHYTINEAQGITDYNSIDFIYNTRSDKNIAYHAGSTIKNDFVLEHIDIKAEGVLMKQYELRYAQRQQQTSYLSEVVERALGGGELNSTVFKYGNIIASQESEIVSTTVGQGESCDLFYGDFDGNGKSDILKAPFYYYGAAGYKCHTGFSVYLNGSTTATFSQSFPSGVLAHITNTIGSAQLLTSDVDGDGKDDIVITYDSYVPVPPFQKFQLDDVQVWRSTSDGNTASFVLTSIGRPNNTYQWLYPELPREYLIPGDYDGDGKTELAFFGYDYQWNLAQVYLWRHGSGWVQQNMGSAANHFGNGKRINVGDFNGDGKMELVSRNSTYSQQCYIVEMTSPNTWGVLFTAQAPTADQEVFLGDFNGDGKHEFLMKTHASSWYVSYSTGTSFTTAWPVTMSPWPDGSSKVLVGDFNGDGKSDIFHGYYASGYKMKLAYSKGLWTSGPSWDWKSFPANDGFATVGLGDFNGDGKTDVITRHHYADPTRILFFNAKTHERRLDKVVNGMGHVVDFDYLYLTEQDVYTEETWGNYNIPLSLVYRVKTSNGIGGTATTVHQYFDSYGMRNGPGFLGFLKHRLESAIHDRRVEDSFYPNGSYASLKPIKNEVFTLASEIPISSKTYIIGGIGLGAMKRHFDRIDMVTNNDYLAGTKSVLSDFVWDFFFNTRQAKVTSYFSSPSSPVEIQVSTTPSFVAQGPYPYPSFPISEEVVSTRTGQPSVTTKTTYEYYPGTGALKKMTEFENKPVKLITELEYYVTGNPKKTTASYTGLAPVEHRVSSWTYDPKYRYPITATERWNKPGLVNISESFSYDPKWGLPLTHLSTDQLQTNFTYDAFGNRTSVSAPFIPGSPRYTISETLAWDVSGNKRYKKTINHPGKPEVSTSYDLLGRELETSTASFATGAKSTATITYNAAGQVLQTTRPKLAGETAQTDTRYYDALGRTSSTVNSLSGTTTFDYAYAGGKLTTTITDAGGRSSSSTTDAVGKMVQSTDNGGTLTNTYDSWGNLLTVKHGVQTLITNTYDAYGRQTKMVDGDAGSTEYLYNAFGLLTWQKNANGAQTTLTYDNLGRLKTRTTPEGTNTWTYYYEDGKFNNNVVTDGSRSFTYNSLGLMETGYGREYVYDSYDRLSQTLVDQVPMQVLLTHTYTPTGHLDQVKMGSTTLFDGITMNGSGRYTSYTMADGKTTTVTYNHQYPTRYYAPSVQDLNMTYQYGTGNLSNRWDKLKLRKEVFTYDNLDRLYTAQVHTTNSSGGIIQSDAQLSYNYDGSVGGTTRGNLAKRTDIGKFASNGHHRITGAMGANYPFPYDDAPLAIAPNTQIITYTSFHQPASISETLNGSPYLLEYTYDANQQRKYSKLRYNWPGEPPLEERWYDHSLETQRFDGDVGTDRKILYVEGGDGLCAMIVADPGGVQTAYAVYKDHLGSIVAVTKKTGGTVSVVAEQNFDPWGRHRIPTTWSYGSTSRPDWLYRGFTGHEHVEPFTLINMNGRMYDPLNGRMLSADNYVQGGLGTQGYNRYSYAGNNPLKYTDPSGNFLAMPFFALSMGAEFLSNIINGVSNPLGQAYTNTSSTMSGVGNSLKLHSRTGANGSMSFGINPLNLGIEFGYGRKDGNVSTGFGFGIGLGGPYMNLSGAYDFGDVTIGASAGMGADGSTRLGGGLEIGGVSLGTTHFGGKDPQWNWQVGYRQGDFSLRMTNDAWTGSDWYRTAAFELGVGQYSIGINMFTTKPPQGEFDDLRGTNSSYRSLWDSFLRKQHTAHDRGTYSSGSRVWAGLYLGYSDGFTVNRTGISAPWVQDFFQNGVHHFITRSSPYFNTALGTPTMPFWQVIGRNPWTLY